MRIQITFNHNKGVFIPFDYQHAVQQWIYKVLSNADKELATQLHDIGYRFEGKSFKLFNFGQWTCFPFKPIATEGMWFNNTHSGIVVSFLLPEQLSTFVSGLFRDQYHTFYFKGGKSISVTTHQIEILPEPTFFDGLAKYKIITGARVSIGEEGKEHPQYIGPDHEEYTIHFIQNLVNKNRSSLLYKGKPTKEYIIDMQVFDPVKTQLFTISKDGNSIKMKGYKFGFELHAPAEIHRTLYYAGAGEGCSMGMGWVEKVEI